MQGNDYSKKLKLMFNLIDLQKTGSVHRNDILNLMRFSQLKDANGLENDSGVIAELFGKEEVKTTEELINKCISSSRVEDALRSLLECE